MTRRELITAAFALPLAPVVATAKPRRKPRAKIKRKPEPSFAPLNAIERAQLVATMPDDTLRLALDLRLLERWSDVELEAELMLRRNRKR